MKLKLYNTRTRQKEIFEPFSPDKVGLYVCGPTVYDWAHLGNARPVVVFDVLVRVLKTLYPQVYYVRNITDVDDKINQAAREQGEPIHAITKKTTQAYHEDMAALGALPPDQEPRATEHIGEMIALIQTLIAQGYAYEAEGHVLFSVKTFSSYGSLSGRSQEEMKAGARVEVAPYKKDPFDFVLWKPSTDQDPGWESPWGWGRPGWHIECSAMSHRYLGIPFDIHGGGHDLVFPHHENEIAQSCCGFKVSLMAHYWVHNGHLMVEGQKMSKSLGNFLTVRDLLDQYEGEVLRLALLSTHYRQPLDWKAEETPQRAFLLLNRLYKALRPFEEEMTEETSAVPSSSVLEALYDDLNTPLALTILYQIATDLNRRGSLEQALNLKASARLLGLLNSLPSQWFQQKPETLSLEMIEELIRKRQEARQRKDFAESDWVREELAAQGIILEDTPQGTTWRRS